MRHAAPGSTSGWRKTWRSKASTTADFTPLPVLGLPGWCEDQDDDFYNDAAVFRPKRKVAGAERDQ